MFYIKYDKTFFPFLNYAGGEKKFDALFPRGAHLQASMPTGMATYTPTGIHACAPNPRNNGFQASLHANIHTYRHRCLCARHRSRATYTPTGIDACAPGIGAEQHTHLQASMPVRQTQGIMGSRHRFMPTYTPTGIDACAPNPRNNGFQASLHANIHTYRHRCLCAKPKE